MWEGGTGGASALKQERSRGLGIRPAERAVGVRSAEIRQSYDLPGTFSADSQPEGALSVMGIHVHQGRP